RSWCRPARMLQTLPPAGEITRVLGTFALLESLRSTQKEYYRLAVPWQEESTKPASKQPHIQADSKHVIDETTQQAQRGDRAAQAKLLRDLQDPWFRLCLSLLRDPEK